MPPNALVSPTLLSFVLSAAMLSACGGSSQEPTIEPARVADRAADLVIARLQEATLTPERAAGGQVGEDDPINAGRPWRGSASPLVTIVEINDFQCPFCSRAAPTIDRVLETYPDVRVVFRNNPLPFHDDAPLAHQAALSIFHHEGPEAFWDFHDLLFANQRDGLTRQNLERWAEQVGVQDMAQLRRDLTTRPDEAMVEEDQEWAREIRALGTPHFIINGQRVSGAQPFERFQEVIDEELETAQALVEDGLAREDLFAVRFRALEEEESEPRPSRPPRRELDPAAIYSVPLGSAPTRGSNRALVTIVAFSDFECPFCSRVLPTLEQIEQQYGQDVRLAFKHNPLPFHQNARPAAMAAIEAQTQRGDAAFWQMHDLLFQNQRALSRQDLEGYAQQIGLNMVRFRRALDQSTHEQTIEDDQALAQSLGQSGTPTFFINGRLLRGAQPFPAFQSVIDEELTRARALVQAGTARPRVYPEAIDGGATSPQYLGAAAAAAPTPTPAPPTVYQIPVPRSAPTRGQANAPITIQIFSDFECPFCSRAVSTLDQVAQRFPTEVRFVFRNYPLPMHSNAPLAHEAAWEVFTQGGDRAFWDYHDILFQNRRALARTDLESYAQQIRGINMRRFRRALDQRTHQARIQEDMTAIQTAGARIGTPSFFVNGHLIQGAQPLSRFETEIQRQLGRP